MEITAFIANYVNEKLDRGKEITQEVIEDAVDAYADQKFSSSDYRRVEKTLRR